MIALNEMMNISALLTKIWILNLVESTIEHEIKK